MSVGVLISIALAVGGALFGWIITVERRLTRIETVVTRIEAIMQPIAEALGYATRTGQDRRRSEGRH